MGEYANTSRIVGVQRGIEIAKRELERGRGNREREGHCERHGLREYRPYERYLSHGGHGRETSLGKPRPALR